MKTKNRWLPVILFGLAVSPMIAETIAVSFDYTLQGVKTGVSTSGYNTIALPFVREGALDKAQDLMDDIEADMPAQNPAGSVTSISKYNRATGGLTTYAGVAEPNNFAIEEGDFYEGYLVKITYDDGGDNNFDYTIGGDHDTAETVTLEYISESSSAQGFTWYSPPYPASRCLVETASDLEAEIEWVTASSVNKISKWSKTSDDWVTHTSDIVPGEAYRIEMSETTTFTPSTVDLDDVVADIDDILSVTAHPSAPGCEFFNGVFEVINNSPVVDFRVDITAAFKNQAFGALSCSECTSAHDGCDPDGCSDCDWCDSEVDAEIGALGEGIVGAQMPFCTPSCDNRSCDGGPNDGKHCLDDDVNGYDPGDFCDNHSTEEDYDCVGNCPTDPHCTIYKPGTGEVTVTAFRCADETSWVEKVCSIAKTPCTTTCPGSETCDSVSEDWGGVIDVPNITKETQICCISSCE